MVENDPDLDMFGSVESEELSCLSVGFTVNDVNDSLSRELE